MRPLLLRPALFGFGASSDFSGLSVVISAKSETVWKRRPGLVGLYCLTPMTLFSLLGTFARTPLRTPKIPSAFPWNPIAVAAKGGLPARRRVSTRPGVSIHRQTQTKIIYARRRGSKQRIHTNTEPTTCTQAGGRREGTSPLPRTPTSSRRRRRTKPARVPRRYETPDAPTWRGADGRRDVRRPRPGAKPPHLRGKVDGYGRFLARLTVMALFSTGSGCIFDLAFIIKPGRRKQGLPRRAKIVP